MLAFTDVRAIGTFPSHVQIRFSLRDQGGRSVLVHVDDLQQAVSIFERGVGATTWEEIDYAETNFFVQTATNFELEVVFVLDFTNSMARARLTSDEDEEASTKTGIDVMLGAFEEAVNSLPGAHRIGVVEFHDRNTEPAVVSQLTTDRQAVLEAVNTFAESAFEPGSSRVWDGIQTASSLFTTVEDNPDVVRALVFVSDGRDTSSTATRNDAAATAARDVFQLYSLGIGEVFEEAQLARMVTSTGGEYYPTRELDALQNQLSQVVADLVGQYRVSYVTLRRAGLYEMRVDVDLEDSVGSFLVPSLDASEFYAPDTEGRIAIDPPSLDRDTGMALVFIRAQHVPRNVNEIRFAVDTSKPVAAGIVTSTDGGVLEGWKFSGPGPDGFYSASAAVPLEFGSLGLLFYLTMSEVTEKSLEVPITFDNSIYTGSKSFVHPPSFFLGERIPAAGRIAFRTTRDGDAEIYVMNFDGTEQTNVTNDTATDYLGTWSPSGDTIIFDSNRDFHRHLFTMSSDGSGVTTLTSAKYNDALPELSRDGAQVVFDSDRDGNREIYVLDLADLGQRRVTVNAARDWWATWSPDRRRIAFTSDRDGNAEIYVMNADGTGVTNLTNDPAGDYRPSWSPDGDRIAFYSYRDGNREVYIMDVDGTRQINLTRHPAHDWYPTWSPDGAHLAFTTVRDGNREIYLMNSDGTGLRNLSDDPGDDWSPAWGP